MKYDAAIIGTGPAGLSAALNLKLHNKSIIWFGSSDLSMKVGKSERIANYPGVPSVTGGELNESFRRQIEEMGLEITDKMVTAITSSRRGFMVLADNDIYDARTVLLATGVFAGKVYEGEEELLGKGVSYCATCDGYLYNGKTIGIVCTSERFEHEIVYLAELAEKVYLLPLYKDCGIELDNVEIIRSGISAINGEERISSISLTDGSELTVDGLFIMRTAVAPATLVRGLEMDGPHIVTDRNMKTSKKGCFAAGDCTGRPYQIAKAVGEGNVAAHSMVEYLSELERVADSLELNVIRFWEKEMK